MAFCRVSFLGEWVRSLVTSVADKMMMQGREVEERRRERFGGWVRSLVTRFSGSGK